LAGLPGIVTACSAVTSMPTGRAKTHERTKACQLGSQESLLGSLPPAHSLRRAEDSKERIEGMRVRPPELRRRLSATRPRRRVLTAEISSQPARLV